MDNKYIEDFVRALNPTRNIIIEGQHEDLELWKQWYAGKTPFHSTLAVVKGKEANVEIKQSGFAKMVCEDWASSFMNEDLKIIVPDEKGNDILQEIFEDNDFMGRIGMFTEKYFGLGLGNMIPMPDTLEADEEGNIIPRTNPGNKIKIYMNDATRIVPITVDDSGEILEQAIIKETTNTITIQVHLLEEDDTYLIAEVTGYKDTTDCKFDYDNIKKWKTNSRDKLYTSWHPVSVDNKNLNNFLSTSIFSNAISDLESYDMAYDRFFTEFKNGAKKRFISGSFIEYSKSGEKTSFALGEEDVIINSKDNNDGKSNVNEFNPELRVESFIRGLSFYANLIGYKCGRGEGAYTIDSSTGRPLQTATAEILKNQKAVKNIRKNENFAIRQLKNLVMAIKFVYNSFVSEGALTYEKSDIQITFADNIIEDTSSQKKDDLNEVNQGTMTIPEFRAKWYGESDEDAKRFVYDNGLLVNKYIDALLAHAITPKQFAMFVYGKDEGISSYIEKMMNADDVIEIPTEE